MGTELAGQSEFNFGEHSRPIEDITYTSQVPNLPGIQKPMSDGAMVAELLTALRNQNALRVQLLTTFDSMVDHGMISKSPESYEPIFELVAKNFNSLNERELLMLIGIGNKLKSDHPFLEMVTKESFARFEEYPTYEAVDKLVKPTLENLGIAQKVQAEVTKAIEFLLPLFQGEELVEILKLSSKARILNASIVPAVIERLESLQVEGELNPRDLKTVARILTSVPEMPPNALSPIGDLVMILLDSQQGDELVEAAIYLGRADHINSEFAHDLVCRVLENPESLSGEGCERIFQLCLEAKIKDNSLLLKALERVISVSSHTDIDKLVDCSRHLSAMQFRSPRIFAIIGAQSEAKLSMINSDRLRNIVADCAQLNIIPPVLLSFIDREIAKRELISHGLCDVIFNFARLNFPCPELLAKFERQFDANLPNTWYAPSEVASLMWALAVHKPELAQRVWDGVQESYRQRFAGKEVTTPASGTHTSWIRFDNLNSPSYHGLYHALVAMKMDVPESVLQRVKKATGYTEYAQHRKNNFETAVENTLVKVGVEFRSQYYFEGYVLDFLVQIGERVIALECDGSKYHIAGRQSHGIMNGASTIKTKFLQNRGFEVIRIPSDTWQTVRDPVAYLRKELKLK